MRLTGEILSQTRLTDKQRREMLALMIRHYDNVQADVFLTDLAEKDWVIVLYDRGGSLCGFSTQMLFEVEVEHTPVRALFSGDTVVDRDFWGDPTLSHLWGQLALRLIDDFSDRELYWFLISKGFRTYRFLPLFFHEFYPRYDQAIPASFENVLDALAVARFGDLYDPVRRIVPAQPNHYRLKDALAEIPESRFRDPNVRFFSDANPFFAAGNELCCLASLTRENFTAAAWRVIGSSPIALELS